MDFPPPLTDKQRGLVNYFRNNLQRPEFAVARRQQWHKLVPMIDKLTGKLLLAQRDAAAYQYLATGLHLSAAGHLTEEQIATASVLNNGQRQDCIQVARIYQEAVRGRGHADLLRRAFLQGFKASTKGYNGELMPEEEILADTYWLAGREEELAELIAALTPEEDAALRSGEMSQPFFSGTDTVENG